MSEIVVDRNDVSSSNRMLVTTLDDCLEIAKALSSELRINILQAVRQSPLNVAEIAEKFDLPMSTAAVNIKKLEDAGLIITELIPGSRGTQKMCAAVVTRIVINLESQQENHENFVSILMPIGHFIDCSVSPTCGMVGDSSIIGEVDDPRTFYEPERFSAQLLWFRKGYVEYRFPNRTPHGSVVQSLELTMEVCSEAPLFNLDWPSDITIWMNGIEIGTWTSPADFGGERGYLTPEWWGTQNTQYGLLKTWRVARDGSYLDGRKISEVKVSDLSVADKPYIAVRIGVKPDAVNDGGINLFGRRFGNYETDLMLRLDYANR